MTVTTTKLAPMFIIVAGVAQYQMGHDGVAGIEVEDLGEKRADGRKPRRGYRRCVVTYERTLFSEDRKVVSKRVHFTCHETQLVVGWVELVPEAESA